MAHLENLCKNLQGQIVNVRQKSPTPSKEKEGIVWIGVLHEFTLHKSSPGLSVVLYQAKRHNDPLMLPMEKLEIAAKEMLEITYHYKEGVHEGGSLKSSDSASTGQDRQLVSWDAENAEDIGQIGDLNENEKDWDQFAVNEKKFGVKSSYTDDNSALYTVALDKNSKDYKEKLLKADKLAAEIESAPSQNVHMIEERTGILQADATEEERYSSVPRPGEASNSQGQPASTSTPSNASTASNGSTNQPQTPNNTPISATPQQASSPAPQTRAGAYVLPMHRHRGGAKTESSTPTTPSAATNEPANPFPEATAQPTTEKKDDTTTKPAEPAPVIAKTEAATPGNSSPSVPTKQTDRKSSGSTKGSVDVSALSLARTTPQIPGKVASEFVEATEASKSKTPSKDLIVDYKKFSMATDKKLEKKKNKQASGSGTPTGTPTVPKKADGEATPSTEGATETKAEATAQADANDTPSKPATSTATPKSPEGAKKDGEKGLNANAPEFKLNPNASEFKPSGHSNFGRPQLGMDMNYAPRYPMYEQPVPYPYQQPLYMAPNYGYPMAPVYNNPYSAQLASSPMKGGLSGANSPVPPHSPQMHPQGSPIQLNGSARVFVPSGGIMLNPNSPQQPQQQARETNPGQSPNHQPPPQSQQNVKK